LGKLLPFLEAGLPREIERPISGEYVRQIVPLIQERITTLGEVAEYTDFFFRDELSYDAYLLIGKKMTKESTLKALKAAQERLSGLDRFGATSLEDTLRPLAEELGLKTGQFFGAIRVAITGRTAAPPLFQTMAVLGQERCLKRIEVALAKLEGV
jgi:glutamyl-tRNA synthetase